MKDKELLELAAKACGIESGVCPDGHSGFWDFDWNGAWWTIYVHENHPTVKMPEHCGKEFTRTNCNDGKAWEWNPLTDDGDALRLAVKLEMHINTGSFCHWGAVTHVTTPWHDRQKLSGVHPETHGDDAYAATRRAIVSAAAEIAKAKGGE